MADTKIQWADKVWNPVTGCTKVSAGCRECYAKKLHDMRHKAYLEGKKLPEQYSSPFEEVRYHKNRLHIPYHWKKPQRVFVNSMSDLFHPDVPSEFIAEVFNVMACATRECHHKKYMNCEEECWTGDSHTFMILTKRPERMLQFMTEEIHQITGEWPGDYAINVNDWLLPNVCIGVSVEDQKAADERIPLLLQTPAAVRFISAEPLIGPIDLCGLQPFVDDPRFNNGGKLDWVICGGESGKNARPIHPDWARGLRDQCKDAKVPFFFKQFGQYIPSYQAGEKQDEIADYNKTYGQRWVGRCYHFDDGISMVKVGKKKAGRLLDGVEHNEFPNS